MIKLIELLAIEGHHLFIYGQEEYFAQNAKNDSDRIYKNIQNSKNLSSCIHSSQIVICGMPMTKDNSTVYAPFSKKTILLEDVKKALKNQLFIAGKIPTDFIKKTGEVFDLSLSEELMILNTIPTVEGILKIAIEETDITLHEASIMVFGYGRIGKILCSRLKAFGANVYCVVKEKEDMAWVKEKRYIPILYDTMNENLKNIYASMDIIINTVPSLIIKKEILKDLKKDCLILDVASFPGGVDKEEAKRYKLKVITALGIPGKIAPRTAATYIKNIIQEKIEK